MAQPRTSPVQVITKVAAVLEALKRNQELSAAELSELVDEPRSSVYRLLASLQGVGLVEVGAKRGTYRLGLKLLELGGAVVDRFDVRREAIPVMERIHDITGETVFLCVRRAGEAVCIERLDGRRVRSLELRLGGALPLHAGAAPRVLLAFADESEWSEYAREPMEAFTRNTPTSKRALFAALRETRVQGYAVSDQDVTIGIAALGAPVFDHQGNVVAALSISGARDSILGGAELRSIRTLVTKGAAETSSRLGYRPDAASAAWSGLSTAG